MKNKIKLIASLMVLFLMLALTSCTIQNLKSESYYVKLVNETISESLMAGDKEKLSNFFSNETKETNDFNEKIDLMFDRFNITEITFIVKPNSAGGSKSWDSYVVDYWTISTTLRVIGYTDNDIEDFGNQRIYEFTYCYTIVNLDNKDKEGLNSLYFYVVNHDDLNVNIGVLL